MRKIILTFLVFIFCVLNIHSQDHGPPIFSIINQEIYIEDSWAGQYITLINENDTYYVMRYFCGSGLPVIGWLKYKIETDSDYQIRFSEIAETSYEEYKPGACEEFTLRISGNELELYLNGLKVLIFNPVQTDI